MYAYFIGEVVEVRGESMILEVNHVGYNIRISPKTSELLPPTGNEVKIYTYTNVREDAILLFGFLSAEDLDLFRQLITINGIGPKGAQSILASMSAEELKYAVVMKDAKRITQAQGIGIKTAERLILELKDKVSAESILQSVAMSDLTGSNRKLISGALAEAIEALTSLGFSASDAAKAIKSIENSETMGVEQLIKLAFTRL